MKRRLLLPLGLLLVLLPPLLYGHMLGAPLGSDARLLTYRNELMKDVDGLVKVWTRDFFEGAETGQLTYRSGYYRPVTNTFLWGVHAVAGRDARIYNLVQTLLHGVCSALVLAVVLAVGGSAAAAVGAAVLFVLHPLHAFAATEPAAVADVLFALFYLLAMLAFEGALRAGSRRRRRLALAATTLLAALTLLSKEMGVTLPAVLTLQALLHLHLVRQGKRKEAVGGYGAVLLRTAPAWGVVVLYLVWRFGVLDLPGHAYGYVDEHGLLAVLAAGPKTFLIHASRVFLPLGPSFVELNPRLVARLQPPLSDPLAWAGLLVVLALGGIALLGRSRPRVAFWAAFTLVTFTPLLLVDRIGGALDPRVILTQERWFYLPSIGLFALLAHGAAVLGHRLGSDRARWSAATAALAVLLLLGWSARLHAGRHDDPFAQLRTLYLFPEEELSREERANRLLLYAHWVALPSGDTAEAAARGRRAVDLMPDSPLAAASYAAILAEQERWNEVRALLEPWYRPSAATLARAATTHRRVRDDLNRAGTRLTLLLGRALLRTGEPERGGTVICEAARQGAEGPPLLEALAEARRRGVDPGCGGA